ncbi:MAG: SNF2 helicase associated domain-containing protein [Turicibacter sp.]|nr:SNF2 helicase associated domain-containing protein [Turicibacter sp.]
MKLQLTDSLIKEVAHFEATYQKGKELYQSKAVEEFYTVKSDDPFFPYQIISIVRGSQGNRYEVEVSFDKKGNVRRLGCECPASQKYHSFCKHVIATLFHAQHQQIFPRRIKWESAAMFYQNRTVNQLLNEYEDSLLFNEPSKVSEEVPVQLIPKLRFEGDLARLELSIGRKRFYVIKDLFAFVHSVETQTEVTYGKELTFSHELESFSQDSLKLLQFVKAMVNDQQSYSEHYSIPISHRRALFLSYIKLQEFHQLFLNERLSCFVEKAEWKSVLMTNEIPKITFKIEAAKNQGIILTQNQHKLLIHGYRDHLFILTEDVLCPMNQQFTRDVFPVLKQIMSMDGYLYISKEQLPNFLSLVYPKIEAYLTEESINYLQDKYEMPQLDSKVYLDLNEDLAVEAKVEYGYHGNLYNPLTDELPSTIVRDKVKEAQLMNVFETYDFKIDKDKMVLRDDHQIYQFMNQGVPALISQHEVNATERFKGMSPKQVNKKVSVGVRLQSDLMTFKLEDLAFDVSEYQEVLAQYQLKKKYHRLKDGSFLKLDSEYMQSFFNLVEDLELTEEDLQQDEIQLSKYRALYLERMLEKNEVKSKKNKAFRQLVNDFEQIDEMEYELPQGLQATLRPYQETGYRWLRTLSDYGMGGILADDMGLGKTLQVIALLCAEYEHEVGKPSLIVTPSSLVFNWQAEFERFAPQMRVLTLTGTVSERSEKLSNLNNYDVILTSYDLLRRDIKEYEVAFKYVILDEAHYIKNQATQNAKAVKKLNGEIRFALTGTPLENSIADVWSIFDFILPGYLLSYAKFKKQYENPIIKDQDEKLLARVHQLVAPFILRRLKKDVLTELPDKVESVVYCELDKAQRKLYEATLVSMNNELQAQLEEGNEGQSRMKMLAMLTRLRQLCCHPALYLENYKDESAKLNLCLELIQECKESGHRILLFSQFTSMFDLIAPKLDELGISYFTLTGETKSEQRVALANRFNEGEADVFLISLKAGGTGLNLTGADVVIHYDPWWNMSAQNQATDRAYRMGQQNKVQVYKLIAKDTIEEKIEKLQQRKLELSDSLVKEGETFITHLSMDDIQELFES